MSNKYSTPFPVYNLNTHPTEHTFKGVGPAIDNREYQLAIDNATATIAKIQELLTTILDHRAYALGMAGKFDQAAKDAQEMIAYMPDSAAGYLRMGDLYRIQGRQRCAIETYATGLERISEQNPDHARLVEDKELATQQNESQVDFVANLPLEIVEPIVNFLPDKSKSVCLKVSSVWRNKIFQCSRIWKTFTSGDVADNHLSSIVPHIASHIEDLTINTTSRRVFIRYLSALNSANFDKIKALTLGNNTVQYIDNSIIMPVSNIFVTVGSALTNLALHVNREMRSVTLASLFYYCPHLQTLEYSTLSYFQGVIGDLTLSRPPTALVDMELKSKAIEAKYVAKILPFCPQIRRLLLHGCSLDVLKIIDSTCPNLETFGYNPQNVTIPRLPDTTTRSTPGLCNLYISNESKAIPAAEVLSLVRRNMHSLKTLHANISAKTSERSLTSTYHDLELNNLRSLSFCGDTNDIIQSLILRSIRNCTSLMHLEANSSRDIPGLADALIALPQLEFFNMTHCTATSGEAKLIQLFDKYAANSQSERRLRAVWLRSHMNIISDNVLHALAGNTLLEEVRFHRLSSITAHGLASFFETVCSNLSDVRLVEMNAVTNNILYQIGAMQNLENVHLEKLKNVTDYGVICLLKRTPKLRTLALVKCKSVTEVAIKYAKAEINDGLMHTG